MWNAAVCPNIVRLICIVRHLNIGESKCGEGHLRGKPNNASWGLTTLTLRIFFFFFFFFLHDIVMGWSSEIKSASVFLCHGSWFYVFVLCLVTYVPFLSLFSVLLCAPSSVFPSVFSSSSLHVCLPLSVLFPSCSLLCVCPSLSHLSSSLLSPHLFLVPSSASALCVGHQVLRGHQKYHYVKLSVIIIIMPILFQYRNIRHILGMYTTKQAEQVIYLIAQKSNKLSVTP